MHDRTRYVKYVAWCGAALLMLASERRASATEPYPGIVHTTADAGGGPYHAVTIDLTKYRIVQSRPDAYGQPAATFAQSTGALVVINSNFAPGASGPSCGLLVGHGVLATNSYLDSDSNNCRASIGFHFAEAASEAFDSLAIPNGPAPANVTDVATGMPFLLKTGVKNTATIPKFGTGLAPRTVLGISKDGKTAYLVVTQGRNIPAGAAGYATNGALVDVMANLGAWDAVNLDGGGSSLLWIGSEGGIQNQPTDGAERVVCAHLGVVPAPPPPDAGASSTPEDAGVVAAAPQAPDASANDNADPLPPGADGSGCSCRMHGSTVDGAAPLVGLAALVLFAARRRRRARLLPLLGLSIVVACGSGRSQFPSDTPDGGAPEDTQSDASSPSIAPDDASAPSEDPTTCEEAAAWKSYVGCEYWPTVTANAVWSTFDFAVVASNSGTQPANVTVTGPNGFSTSVTISPGALQTIYLPWVASLKGPESDECTQLAVMDHSVVAQAGAYHVVSSRPIVLYQFNALEYKGAGGASADGGAKDWSSCPGTQVCAQHGKPWGCYSFSNDASLLLPTTALTGNYRVLGMHGWTESTTDLVGPFVAITATQDGTHVSLHLAASARVLAGTGVTAANGGDTLTLTLNTGDVAEVMGDKGKGVDFSGSLVQADKPIQVIAGNPCIYLPQGTGYCDHLESSVLPAETLGKHYLASVPTSPNGNVVGHIVRLYGNVDGTTLTYFPSRPPTCPTTLNAGEIADCGIVSTNFEVQGDHEFAVASFMLGGSQVDPTTNLTSKGDPSQSLFAGVEQFRRSYIFLAPADYDVSYADITGPSDAAPILDGAPITAPFQMIGANGYGLWRVKLGAGNAGAHTLRAAKPVGVQVIGYGMFTSYQYPGGLNLAHIATPPK